jgi:hypothetical protein
MASKQRELEIMQEDASEKVALLENETKAIRVRFQENGQYEKYDKVKDENGGISGRIVPPQINADAFYNNFNIVNE